MRRTVTSEADLRHLSIRNPTEDVTVADAPGPANVCVHKSRNLEPMLVRGTFALVIGLSLAQCSSAVEKISTEPISPAAYQSYTCSDLARADQDLSSKASELNPKEETWSGVQSFFGFRTQNPEATRLAELKGQLKAIEQVKSEKKC
jgi:hypothetical protein